MPNHFIHERRQYGTKVAIRRFFHRRLSFFAFLILALAVAYSLASIRNEGITRRHELANAGAQAAYQTCQQINLLRQDLRGILIRSEVQTKLAIKNGVIPRSEAKTYLTATRKDIKQLHKRDCSSFAQPLKKLGSKPPSFVH